MTLNYSHYLHSNVYQRNTKIIFAPPFNIKNSSIFLAIKMLNSLPFAKGKSVDFIIFVHQFQKTINEGFKND